MRVGESCSYIPGKHETDNGQLYVIGGANPSGPFCDTYVLDLNTYRWDFIDSPGFRARYEHAAFTPESQPWKIYVFGGADQTGNMNDIQLLDTNTNTWSSVAMSGTPPTERTYHTNSAIVGDKFIVYGGGHCGADPVTDRQVHMFDTKSHTWQTINVKGDSPKPRHGHVVVAAGNKVYIHGGMSGPNFYNDMHVLDLEKLTWSDIKRKKVYPTARAGHSGVAIGTNIYLFGGMTRDGALDETWKFNTCKLPSSVVTMQFL
jgi:N-acetylneuraminic acid mutarotase